MKYNREQYWKIKSKKQARAEKKEWVTLSITALALLGATGVHKAVHADPVNTPNPTPKRMTNSISSPLTRVSAASLNQSTVRSAISQSVNAQANSNVQNQSAVNPHPKNASVFAGTGSPQNSSSVTASSSSVIQSSQSQSSNSTASATETGAINNSTSSSAVSSVGSLGAVGQRGLENQPQKSTNYQVTPRVRFIDGATYYKQWYKDPNQLNNPNNIYNSSHWKYTYIDPQNGQQLYKTWVHTAQVHGKQGDVANINSPTSSLIDKTNGVLTAYQLIDHQQGITVKLGSNHNINGNDSSDSNWIGSNNQPAPAFDYVSQPVQTTVHYYDTQTGNFTGQSVILHGYYDDPITSDQYVDVPNRQNDPRAQYDYALDRDHLNTYFFGHVPNGDQISAPVYVKPVQGKLPVIFKDYEVGAQGRKVLKKIVHSYVNVWGYPNIHPDGHNNDFYLNRQDTENDLSLYQSINAENNSNSATLQFTPQSYKYKYQLSNVRALHFFISSQPDGNDTNNFNYRAWEQDSNNNTPEYDNSATPNFVWNNGITPEFVRTYSAPNVSHQVINYNNIWYRVIKANQYNHSYTWKPFQLPNKAGKTGITVYQNNPQRINIDTTPDPQNVKKIWGESAANLAYSDDQMNNPESFNLYDLLAYDEKQSDLNKDPDSPDLNIYNEASLEHGVIPDAARSANSLTIDWQGNVNWNNQVPFQSDSNHFYYDSPTNANQQKNSIGSIVINEPYVPTVIKFIDSDTGKVVPFSLDGTQMDQYNTAFSRGASSYILHTGNDSDLAGNHGRVYFVGQFSDPTGNKTIDLGVNNDDPTQSKYFAVDPNTSKVINDGKGYINLPDGYQFDGTAQDAYVQHAHPNQTDLGNSGDETNGLHNYLDGSDYPPRLAYLLPQNEVGNLPATYNHAPVSLFRGTLPQNVPQNDVIEFNAAVVNRQKLKPYENPDGVSNNQFNAGQDINGKYHYYSVYPIYIDNVNSKEISVNDTPIQKWARVKFVYVKNGFRHQVGKSILIGGHSTIPGQMSATDVSLTRDSKFWAMATSGRYTRYDIDQYQYLTAAGQQKSATDVNFDQFNSKHQVGQQSFGDQELPVYGDYTIYLTSPDIRVHYRMANAGDGHAEPNATVQTIDPNYKDLIDPINDTSGNLNFNQNNNLEWDANGHCGTPFSIDSYTNQNTINRTFSNRHNSYRYVQSFSVPAFGLKPQDVYVYITPQRTVNPQNPQTYHNYVQFIYVKNGYQHRLGLPITISGPAGHYRDMMNGSNLYRYALNNEAKYGLQNLDKFRYVRSEGSNGDVDRLSPETNGKTYHIYVTSPNIRIHYRLAGDPGKDIPGSKKINDRTGHLNFNQNGGTSFNVHPYITPNAFHNNLPSKYWDYVPDTPKNVPTHWGFNKQDVYIYIRPKNPNQTPGQNYWNRVQFVYVKNGYRHDLGTPIRIIGSKNSMHELMNGSTFYRHALKQLAGYNLGKYRYVRSDGSDGDVDILNDKSNHKTYHVYVTTPDIRIHYRLASQPNVDINGSRHPDAKNGNLILGQDNNYAGATTLNPTPFIQNLWKYVPSRYATYTIDQEMTGKAPQWNFDKQDFYIYLRPASGGHGNQPNPVHPGQNHGNHNQPSGPNNHQPARPNKHGNHNQPKQPAKPSGPTNPNRPNGPSNPNQPKPNPGNHNSTPGSHPSNPQPSPQPSGPNYPNGNGGNHQPSQPNNNQPVNPSGPNNPNQPGGNGNHTPNDPRPRPNNNQPNGPANPNQPNGGNPSINPQPGPDHPNNGNNNGSQPNPSNNNQSGGNPINPSNPQQPLGPNSNGGNGGNYQPNWPNDHHPVNSSGPFNPSHGNRNLTPEGNFPNPRPNHPNSPSDNYPFIPDWPSPNIPNRDRNHGNGQNPGRPRFYTPRNSGVKPKHSQRSYKYPGYPWLTPSDLSPNYDRGNGTGNGTSSDGGSGIGGHQLTNSDETNLTPNSSFYNSSDQPIQPNNSTKNDSESFGLSSSPTNVTSSSHRNRLPQTGENNSQIKLLTITLALIMLGFGTAILDIESRRKKAYQQLFKNNVRAYNHDNDAAADRFIQRMKQLYKKFKD